MSCECWLLWQCLCARLLSHLRAALKQQGRCWTRTRHTVFVQSKLPLSANLKAAGESRNFAWLHISVEGGDDDWVSLFGWTVLRNRAQKWFLPPERLHTNTSSAESLSHLPLTLSSWHFYVMRRIRRKPSGETDVRWRVAKGTWRSWTCDIRRQHFCL